MKEDIRLTVYFNNHEQKEKIQNLIRNVKIKNNLKKTGDALEFICNLLEEP